MKLGFIGTGNMAGAIMGGIIGQGLIPASEIIGSDVFAAGREKVKDQYGIHVTENNKEVVEKADKFILSVKPQFYASVIEEIKDVVREDQIIITIAPGKTLKWLEEQFTVKDRSHNAEYAGDGRRGDDCRLRKRASDGRRTGRGSYNVECIRKNRGGAGAFDRRSRIHKRKFSGICIYDDRSDGRRSGCRRNGTSAGL